LQCSAFFQTWSPRCQISAVMVSREGCFSSCGSVPLHIFSFPLSLVSPCLAAPPPLCYSLSKTFRLVLSFFSMKTISGSFTLHCFFKIMMFSPSVKNFDSKHIFFFSLPVQPPFRFGVSFVKAVTGPLFPRKSLAAFSSPR